MSNNIEMYHCFFHAPVKIVITGPVPDSVVFPSYQVAEHGSDNVLQVKILMMLFCNIQNSKEGLDNY